MADKDFTMAEILQEVLEDESWEPDKERRELAIASVRMSLM